MVDLLLIFRSETDLISDGDPGRNRNSNRFIDCALGCHVPLVGIGVSGGYIMVGSELPFCQSVLKLCCLFLKKRFGIGLYQENYFFFSLIVGRNFQWIIVIG